MPDADTQADARPDARLIEETRLWLERAVIGLNLCPFAKSVHVKGQVHYAVSRASGWTPLLEDLEREVQALLAHDIAERETTLLIVPALSDFYEFNGFLAEADRLLERREWVGTIQLASFHPQFEFADAEPGDITHHTNRAPHPTLHLLREDSIARAVQAFPEADAIYDTNKATLRRLGPEGLKRVLAGEGE